jgi:hypothetical protein
MQVLERRSGKLTSRKANASFYMENAAGCSFFEAWSWGKVAAHPETVSSLRRSPAPQEDLS